MDVICCSLVDTLFRGVIRERGSLNSFNSFATSTKRETVRTVAIDLSLINTQLKLGVMRRYYRIHCWKSLVFDLLQNPTEIVETDIDRPLRHG